MNRSDSLSLLYPKMKSLNEFKFDSLFHPPILYYLSIQDIAQLNKIATSVRLSSKPKQKYAMIDRIMSARGFVKMASGTNRVVYRYNDDYSFVLKIAIDKVGMKDNPAEYQNQQLLKPFVSKCFDVSRCGTVGMFERVTPITYREEFLAISDDVFDLINKLIGKYVLEDIGEKYYQNYGIRDGFGPVLLDYPYVYELDGGRLICNNQDPITQLPCRGEIDYDLGYNDLVCKKCGKRYIASDLKVPENDSHVKITVEGKEENKMKCSLVRGNEIVQTFNNEGKSATVMPSSPLKLRVSLERKPVEDNKEIPEIKTHDDVNLKVGVRVPKNRRDEEINEYDKKAREEEAKKPVVSVSMNDTKTEVKEDIVEEPKKVPLGVSFGRSESVEAMAEKAIKEVGPKISVERKETPVKDGIDSETPIDWSNRELLLDIKSGSIITSEHGVVLGTLKEDQFKELLEAVGYYTRYKYEFQNDRPSEDDKKPSISPEEDFGKYMNSPEEETKEEIETVEPDEKENTVGEEVETIEPKTYKEESVDEETEELVDTVVSGIINGETENEEEQKDDIEEQLVSRGLNGFPPIIETGIEGEEESEEETESTEEDNRMSKAFTVESVKTEDIPSQNKNSEEVKKNNLIIHPRRVTDEEKEMIAENF